MRSLLPLLALVPAAVAQWGDTTEHFDGVDAPAASSIVTAGQKLKIKWEATIYAESKQYVNIALLGGCDDKHLNNVTTLPTGKRPEINGVF